MFFSFCRSFLIDNKAESLRFVCESFVGLKKFDDFCKQRMRTRGRIDESMHLLADVADWSKSQCAKWWKQFNHKLTRGMHNRATCLVLKKILE